MLTVGWQDSRATDPRARWQVDLTDASTSVGAAAGVASPPASPGGAAPDELVVAPGRLVARKHQLLLRAQDRQAPASGVSGSGSSLTAPTSPSAAQHLGALAAEPAAAAASPRPPPAGLAAAPGSSMMAALHAELALGAAVGAHAPAKPAPSSAPGSGAMSPIRSHATPLPILTAGACAGRSIWSGRSPPGAARAAPASSPPDATSPGDEGRAYSFQVHGGTSHSPRGLLQEAAGERRPDAAEPQAARPAGGRASAESAASEVEPLRLPSRLGSWLGGVDV